ncbi:DUF5129 domain-containing protein [Actinomyces sp. ZJ308]|uniref:DUF5129 domain-containing protein n=1 Tax=Actinomyces sp. ZJ308 TaxID=2708342 RepID=UPI00141EB20D|nr:DUF5129 domain-containing protein [Actinomyces sp. ZJ308]
MPPTHPPLIVRLGGIRSLLAFSTIMTGGLAAVLSPVAAAVRAPRLLPPSLLLTLLGAGCIAYYLWRGLTARRVAGQALRHYSQVTHDYEATELQARLIPEGEPRGARVMARYRWFRDEYENLTRSWQDLGSPRGAQWFDPGMLGRVTELGRRSAALDSTDDVIAGDAALLTLSSSWERRWYDEQRPVLQDLDLLLGLCQQIDSHAFAPGGTVEAREQVRAHHQRLTEMTAELSAGRLQPSAALDELTWIAADVRRSASGLALRAAATGPPLNPLNAGAHRRLDARGSPGVVGPGRPGRHRGYWYPTGGHVGVGPTGHGGSQQFLAARARFFGDGTFPGL